MTWDKGLAGRARGDALNALAVVSLLSIDPSRGGHETAVWAGLMTASVVVGVAAFVLDSKEIGKIGRELQEFHNPEDPGRVSGAEKRAKVATRRYINVLVSVAVIVGAIGALVTCAEEEASVGWAFFTIVVGALVLVQWLHMYTALGRDPKTGGTEDLSATFCVLCTQSMGFATLLLGGMQFFVGITGSDFQPPASMVILLTIVPWALLELVNSVKSAIQLYDERGGRRKGKPRLTAPVFEYFKIEYKARWGTKRGGAALASLATWHRRGGFAIWSMAKSIAQVLAAIAFAVIVAGGAKDAPWMFDLAFHVALWGGCLLGFLNGIGCFVLDGVPQRPRHVSSGVLDGHVVEDE